MKEWTRTMLYAATILLVLGISAMLVGPAYADDGAPPPPSTDPAVTTGDGTSSVDLSEVPAGTDVVVLDKKGKKVPLATQAAADILATSDPLWCPSGVAPHPLVGGCSDSYGSIDTLVNNFTPTGSGTIWVTFGAASAGATIDGTSGPWNGLGNFSLTVQGGWNGVNGSKALNTTTPYSTFSDYLYIQNWTAPVTLNNLTFDSVTYSTTYAFNALYVDTKGNISVNKVDVVSTYDSDNTLPAYVGNGALLTNTAGTGNVTVKNSHFNANEGYGLQIYSKGTVTLKNVAANNNDEEGVYINNTFASSAKPVMVSTSQFNGNSVLDNNFGDWGLRILSNGAVTLTSLVATDNYNYGVRATNTALGSYPVSVKGYNDFSNNGSDGLHIFSDGSITVSNITANNNSGAGVYLDNSGAPSALPVTIIGALTAIGNTYDGLDVYSLGLVKAANLVTNDSASGYGTYIDNCQWNGSSCDGTGAVTLTGTNVFNDNDQNGLYVNTLGAITISNITAIFNGSDGGANDMDGVDLYPGDYTHQTAAIITGFGLFKDNYSDGLYIGSFGTVTLNNIVADANGSDGVNIDNTGGISPTKSVTFKGFNEFNYNGGNGLFVNSQGAILLNNATAYYNSGGDGVYLQNDTAVVPSKVAITGFGLFEWNGASSADVGLYVTSVGAITLANITANYNNGDGAYLTTIAPLGYGPQTITLTGFNNFNYNGQNGASTGSGLEAYSDGNIKVSNVNGNYNTGSGVYLDNCLYDSVTLFACTGVGSVTLTGFGHFDGNTALGGDGLYIYTHSSVTLSNVSANSNSYFAGAGIYIKSEAGNATLTCSSAYNNTGFVDGLYVSLAAGHTLTLKGFYAYGNSSDEFFTGGFDTVNGVHRSPCP